MKFEITESSERYAAGTYGDFNFIAERGTNADNWVIAISNPKRAIIKVQEVRESKELTTQDICRFAGSMMFIHSQEHSVDILYAALYKLAENLHSPETQTAVTLLLESAEKLKNLIELVDGAYTIVEIWKAESPSQKEWQKNWLTRARANGANPE